VRFANIDIIEGLGASHHGIGIVIARIFEAVLRDEKLAAPIGSWQADRGVTFSLASVIGAAGVEAVLESRLDDDERQLLARSVRTLQAALAHAWAALDSGALSPA
jgi:L-lactate dehydrogenase